MSAIVEWFEGRSVDEHYQRCNWSRILTEIACAVVAWIILGSLPGCASEEVTQQICVMNLIGTTTDSNPVVRLQCISPEAFAESQK